MSAPLNLTTEQLRTIATALDELAEITRVHGVDFNPHGLLAIGIGENTLRVARDGDAYVIDDRNGE